MTVSVTWRWPRLNDLFVLLRLQKTLVYGFHAYIVHTLHRASLLPLFMPVLKSSAYAIYNPDRPAKYTSSRDPRGAPRQEARQ